MTDYDYVETLGIELVAGRDFSREEKRTDAGQAALINEAAFAALGLTSPVGAQLELSVPLTRTVVGVIRDFHMQSFHYPIEPVMLLVSPDKEVQSIVYSMIRIRGENISQTLAFIQQTWEDIHPGCPFEYSFLDQDMDRLYDTEQRIQRSSASRRSCRL